MKFLNTENCSQGKITMDGNDITEIEGLIVFFDDILIVRDTAWEHDKILNKISRASNLNIKFNKSIQYKQK